MALSRFDFWRRSSNTAFGIVHLMKSQSVLIITLAAALSTSTFGPVLGAEPFVYETAQEFFANGDFDGDGRRDRMGAPGHLD